MKRLTLPIIAMLCAATLLTLSCRTQDRVRTAAALDEAETLMEKHPDSALLLLEALDREVPAGHRTRARHALLYSQALDKNWIDVASDSIIRPAVRYYSRHGSPDERLKTFYYYGCTFLNAGNQEKAMEQFVRAERYAGKAEDLLTAGRLHSAMRTIYADLYDFDRSYQEALKSFRYYREAGDSAACVKALVNAAQNAGFLDRYRQADSLLSLLRNNYWDMMGQKWKGSYYAVALMSAGKKSDSLALTVLRQYLRDVTSPEYVEWAVVADIYLRNGDTDSAALALDLYPCACPEYQTSAQYHYIRSMVEESSGRYAAAYGALRTYTDMVDREDMAKLREDTRFIEERYRHEMRLMRQRYIQLLTVSVLLMIALLAAVMLLKAREKAELNALRAAEAKRRADEADARFEEMRERLEKEKAALMSLQSSDQLTEEARRVINDRIVLITHMLARKAGSPGLDFIRYAEGELEKLMADKNAFILATLMAYTVVHPKFVAYLRDHGLSEWETGYCCMYAMGLRGKDMGNLLNDGGHAHHNRASAIRAKLGLSPHDARLSRWLPQLIRTLEAEQTPSDGTIGQ